MQELDNRKQKILNMVVNSYITTAEPIGSRLLLATDKLNCGEATIRNELRVLEEEGYLSQPHTSAGRIPIAKGYQYFVDNLDKQKIKLNKKDNDCLGLSIKEAKDYKASRKNLAKTLSELANQTVLLAFSPDSVYYTGLSNLFSQPEFNELQLVADVSKIFDHCENCLDDFYDQVEEEVTALIGSQHPFGDMLSVVTSRFSNKNIDNGLIVLMGPIRMDYHKNLALLNRVIEII